MSTSFVSSQVDLPVLRDLIQILPLRVTFPALLIPRGQWLPSAISELGFIGMQGPCLNRWFSALQDIRITWGSYNSPDAQPPPPIQYGSLEGEPDMSSFQTFQGMPVSSEVWNWCLEVEDLNCSDGL